MIGLNNNNMNISCKKEPSNAERGEGGISDLKYDIIISGNSFNVIRNHNYLWDHFLLIAYFAKSLVGFEMTDE